MNEENSCLLVALLKIQSQPDGVNRFLVPVLAYCIALILWDLSS
jgi:hypothetical protein